MAEQDLNAFANAYTNLTKVNQQSAQQTAGNALAKGDFSGAANTLYKAGDLENGQKVQTYSDTQRVQHAQAAQRITKGIRAAVQAGHTPQEAYAMATQIAPQLGVDPAEFAKLKPAFDQDPRAVLDMLDQQAAKELQFFQTDSGILAGDKNTGNVKMAYGLPGKPIAMDPDKNYVAPNTTVGPPGAAPQPGAQPAPDQPIATARPDADAVFNAIIAQESGGRPGVSGPKTQYGVAQGIGQLLPQTGQAMAQKLGVPWRPDLMTAKTPEGQQYQTQLSRAYFDQAWQASGGDPAQAAKYYYGGPNQKIWGPKTQAYAQDILRRVGGQGAVQGGAGSDAIDQTGAPPGYHFIQRAAPADESNLTPDAIEQNAMRYVMTGQMPALGQKAKEERNAILNRSAAIAKQYDIKPEDVVTGMATFKVTQGSLAQISKVASMVQASENTVVANADLALSLAPKGGGPTGSPVLNRWIQAGRKSIAGDPDVAKFDAALGTVADEYAKVMTTNTGTGGAGTSDSARNEAYHRLNSAMTYQQLQGVIGVMKREMANRTQQLQGQQAALTDQLRHGVVPGGQAAQPGAPQPGAPAAASPAPAANGYHPAQIATAQRLVQSPNFRGTPLGAAGNPYAPRNAAEFQAIPNGKSYIDDDGQVYVKGRR